MINLLVADNQPLTREGCVAVLSATPNINITGFPTTRAELKEQITILKPHVVIIDHYFDDQFGNNFIAELSGLFKSTHILVLSDNQNRDEIVALSEHGINYISKRCNRTEVIEAVNATAKGQPYFCNSIQQILQPLPTVTLPQLSVREAEIVQLIADGLTNKDIADRLYISIHTIKTHRKNIIKKLGFTFKNAAELTSLIQSL